MLQSVSPGDIKDGNPADRQRNRYGRLPRRTKPITASLEPDLHQQLTAAVAASGITTSAWVAEAIALRLRMDSTNIEEAAKRYAIAKAELQLLMQEPEYDF
jgi:hypothetical protein